MYFEMIKLHWNGHNSKFNDTVINNLELRSTDIGLACKIRAGKYCNMKIC